MPAVYHVLQPRENPRLLSVVIPAYNEEEMIPILRPQLTAFLNALPCAAEVIFVNDGSGDRTLSLLAQWAAEDQRIKVLGLARNFGHQAAVTAGLDAAAGDAVVIMDADLQDPPAVVIDMLEKYRQGYDVVCGQRSGRPGESRLKRLTAWGFYRAMQIFVHKDLPADSGDFRLISRACLNAVRQMRETHRFLRGMVAWVGFPQTAVQFQRPPRAAGTTKYPFLKMVKFAWTAAISFSTLPLRISLTIGTFVAVLGLLAGVYAVVAKWTGLYTVPGWTSQMVIMSVLSGAILISNGILGEYIGRSFEELKDRPLYIVSMTANFPKAAPGENWTTTADRGAASKAL